MRISMRKVVQLSLCLITHYAMTRNKVVKYGSSFLVGHAMCQVFRCSPLTAEVLILSMPFGMGFVVVIVATAHLLFENVGFPFLVSFS